MQVVCVGIDNTREPGYAPPSIMREQHQIARQELDALIREVRDQTSIDADALIAKGEPAEVLIEVAHDADLLVLGAGSHGRATRLIMGSTTQRCVTAGVVPLAIIPRLDPGLSSHPIPRVVRCEAS